MREPRAHVLGTLLYISLIGTFPHVCKGDGNNPCIDDDFPGDQRASVALAVDVDTMQVFIPDIASSYNFLCGNGVNYTAYQVPATGWQGWPANDRIELHITHDCCGSEDAVYTFPTVCGSACYSQGGGTPTCTTVNNGSVDLRIDVGRSLSGIEGGFLNLYSKTTSDRLSRPESLVYGVVEGMEIIRQTNGILRQVRGLDLLADIVTNDAFSFEVNLYYPTNIGSTNVAGLYLTNGVPVSRWSIRNPSGTTTDVHTLQVRNVVGVQTTSYDYVWIDTNNEWRLTVNNGLKTETRSTTWSSNNTLRTEVHKVMGLDQQVVAKDVSIYRLYPWGMAIDQKITDPDGAARTTTYTYYTDTNEIGRLGRERTVVYPDGSWMRCDYDSEGRITEEVKPWMDSPLSSSNDDADATYYSYSCVCPIDAADTNTNWKASFQRTVTRKVLGVTVGRTYFSYFRDLASGCYVKIEEKAATPNAAFGATGNQRTTLKYHRDGVCGEAHNGLYSKESPDGSLDLYCYESGNFTTNVDPSLNQFEVSSAGTFHRRSVLHTTKGATNGVAFRSTKDVTIQRSDLRTVLEEKYVFTGSQYERIDWTAYFYNGNGQVADVRKSDGTEISTTWNCCGKESESDSTGSETLYYYDGLKRLVSEVKAGCAGGEYPSQPDLVTDWSLDASGHRRKETASGGGLSLASTNTYDLGGGLIVHTDAAGISTLFEESDGGRVRKVTFPSGSLEVRTNYVDGSLRSLTGSAQTESITYKGINSDGTVWTKTFSGPAGSNSLSWKKVTTDCLGRIVKEEFSAFRGAVTTNAYYFNTKGQIVREARTGMPDMLYEYDSFGRVIRSGFDVDGGGSLVTTSMDRIVDSTNYFEKVDSNWWETAIESSYPVDCDGTQITQSIQRVRLTGLSSSLESEVVRINVLGSSITNRVAIDRTGKKETLSSTQPDSTNHIQTVKVNGMVMATVGKSAHRISYLYDGLRRQTNFIDPRIGAMRTHYNTKGQVDFTVDAAGFTNFMAYDSAGRQAAVTNALGKVKRMDYDVRNNVTMTSGDTDYPIIYTFDPFGRMATMKTFRGATNGTADTTTWRYDEASGLLTNKVYNDGTLTAYTYHPQGTLATRTWARNTTTTYSYDLLNQLLNVNYSDSTPDVTNAYDRIGRMTNVVDGQGNHSYAYSLQGLETIETCPEGTLTRSYDSLGRSTGFGIAGDYALVYGYDQVGRFGSITSTIMGSTRAFGYEYLADSDLLAGMTNDVSKWEKRYEPNRNLLTGVTNKVGAGNAIVSRFTYGNDPLGRRTNRLDSGDSYQPATTNLFDYNDRSEVVSATMSQNHAFGYDNIGNRISASNGGAAYSYVVNGLNQYTNSTISGTPYELGYDPDGNMLTNRGVKYTWNAENQLIIAESASPANGHRKVESYYDSRGRRWKKVVFIYTNSDYTVLTTNLFLYDGWNLVRETRQGVSSAVVTTNHHIWGLDLSGSLQGAGGIGGLLQKTTASNGTVSVALYYADGNGNIVSAVDEAGTTVATWKWDPYGRLVSGAGTLVAAGDPWRFSSKYFDAETALYYYGYRFYDSDLGRWITRDPLAEQSGTPNLFEAMNNDPVRNVDGLGQVVMSMEYDITGIHFTAENYERPGREGPVDDRAVAPQDPSHTIFNVSPKAWATLNLFWGTYGNNTAYATITGTSNLSAAPSPGGSIASSSYLTGNITFKLCCDSKRYKLAWIYSAYSSVSGDPLGPKSKGVIAGTTYTLPVTKPTDSIPDSFTADMPTPLWTRTFSLEVWNGWDVDSVSAGNQMVAQASCAQ